MISVISANVASVEMSGSASTSVNHTGVTGYDRTVYAAVMIEGAGLSVSSITYGGTSMRYVNKVYSPTNDNMIEIWEVCDEEDGYSAIPLASNTVSIVMSAASFAAMVVFQVNGLDRTIVDEAIHAEDAQSLYTGTVDVEKEDSLLLSFLCTGNNVGSVTQNNGQTVLYSAYNIASVWAMVAYKMVDRGSQVQSITCGSAANRGIYYVTAQGPSQVAPLSSFGGS